MGRCGEICTLSIIWRALACPPLAHAPKRLHLEVRVRSRVCVCRPCAGAVDSKAMLLLVLASLVRLLTSILSSSAPSSIDTSSMTETGRYGEIWGETGRDGWRWGDGERRGETGRDGWRRGERSTSSMTSALHARHSFPRRLVADRIMSASGRSPSPIPAQWCNVTPPTAQAAMAVVAVAAVVSAGSRLRSDLRRKDLPAGGACGRHQGGKAVWSSVQ